MILYPYILWLLFAESYSEAKFDKGEKAKAKLIQSIWIASWFLLPVLVHASSWFYLLVPVSYLILRIGIFDILYNAFYGHEWNYTGTTSWLWDKWITKVKSHNTIYIILIAVCIVSSFYILHWIR